jgi:hypothetical protein
VEEIPDPFEKSRRLAGNKIHLPGLRGTRPQPRHILVGMARQDNTKYVLDQKFLEFRLFIGKDPVALDQRINME